MIVAAALCPAAPLLIPGVADELAAEQADLVTASRLAVSTMSGPAERLLVVTPGPQRRWTPELGDPGTHPFGRSDRSSAPGDHHGAGVWVASALTGGRLPTAVLELGPSADPGQPGQQPGAAEPAAIAVELRQSPVAVGVLLLVDGAICHGDDAPAAVDDRAAEFDAGLQAVLTVDPDGLRQWCRERHDLAAELGSAAPDALAVLADLLDGTGWSVTARDFGHPYGVGYHVAGWSR